MYMLGLVAVIILVISVFASVLWMRYSSEERVHGDFKGIHSPLVLFDFDGTICDSFATFFDILNDFSEEYNFKKIEVGDVDFLRGMESKEVLEYLGIQWYKFPFIVKRVRNDLAGRLAGLEVFEGVADVLKELNRRGVSMGIVTTNSVGNVEYFLKNNDLEVFDFIYSGVSIFGKHRILRSVCRSAGMNPFSESVYYVGDETRDYKAAKKEGLTPILVSWGFNNKEAFKSLPDDRKVVDVPDELLSAIT